MLLRRLSSLLLLLAASTGTASHAIETIPTTKTHPTKPLTNADGTIKKAPAAKPYKTKKTRTSKHTSKSTSSKTASTKSAPTPRTGATPTKTTVSLHPGSPAVVLSREAITQRIEQSLATPKLGIEYPRALQPFFDQLHQLEADPKAQLVRVIQFGDSHTAGDSFTGALRTLFQQKFGDGGAGFQFAGYPFAGYHIHGTKRAQSTGWLALGTHLNDIGDAMVGMGGVSLLTAAAGNWVSLDADATSLQVQYLIQPNGGSVEIRDNDNLIATVSTASSDTLAPDTAGHFDAPVEPGPHHFEVLTIDQAPVRLLGLSTENSAGVTYEAAGINGAEASLFLRWNEALQQTLMLESNPALIVLSYGTNEAGDRNWTEEGYAAMFQRIIERCRRLAPNASILVVGPPDRALRAGRRAWKPFAGVDRIVAAQRSVCRQMHCAYWDQRSRMGGFGSMRDWVSISWAQPDHTHFTGEGYTELASALFSDILQQYDTYETPLTRAQGETK
ncbi:MAG TPA: SGNH/GDSL hydrolase family protein [Edaphobacter sp.]|jgi:lysophospholipase L1-like esterase|nr:SGNH/GDSL hydrolase family protein [Edaphobacter sp.]